MEKSHDDIMDVDTDNASGIIDMESSIQPNEQNEENNKAKLAEMPKEILEEILIYLDDKSLLKASHVCKSFASAAETAFARKYAKTYYCIDGYVPNEGFYKVMVNKYGGKLRLMDINYGDKELYQLVKQKCGNLKGVFFADVSRIIMLKNLKEVHLAGAGHLDHETFAVFINDNRQLETLKLEDQPEIDFTDILDSRLKMLKMLDLCRIRNIIGLPKIIRLDSLDTLRLELADSESYVRILRAMSCNKIKVLELDYGDDQNQDADVITEICKFETLVSLDLLFYRITSDEVGKLAAHLPHLAKIKMGMAEDQSNPANVIHSMISMFPELTKFTVLLDEDDFDPLVVEMKKPSKEFHARFARSNTVVVLQKFLSAVYITTEYFCIHNGGSIELHWMNDLSEDSVRRVLGHSHWPTAVTFINSCADRAFDFAALAYVEPYPCPDLGVGGLQCVNFKSIGPISVNSKVCYHDLFPHMKSLKIHLEKHSANEYLRNLDAKFCKQIEELWLKAKGASENGDMTHVLAKFENLKSLHLAPSSIKFEADHLFSVCRSLNEIKRIPSGNSEQ